MRPAFLDKIHIIYRQLADHIHGLFTLHPRSDNRVDTNTAPEFGFGLPFWLFRTPRFHHILKCSVYYGSVRDELYTPINARKVRECIQKYSHKTSLVCRRFIETGKVNWLFLVSSTPRLANLARLLISISISTLNLGLSCAPLLSRISPMNYREERATRI